MLGRFLRRLTQPEAPAPVLARSATPVALAQPDNATAAAAAVSRPPALAEPEAREVASWLELDVRTRIASVQDSLSRDDRESDAPAFLDAISASFDAVVRQPPLAAQRALSVTRDSNASASRLVGLVETDPGLSQGLLRYANSAFYSTGASRCVSLLNAVQRVGTTGVHNVVLRTMVDGLLCRPGGLFQGHVDLVWQHMVRTAPIARAIAPPLEVVPDEAYALGLLHDVGKLVVFDRLGELRRSLRREVLFPPAVMSVVLRYLHEPLGGLAALQWGLGPGVAHAIATHRRSPVPEMFDRRCEVLYLAEKIDLWRVAEDRAPEDEAPLDDWWRDGALNVDVGAVRRLVAELPVDDEAGQPA